MKELQIFDAMGQKQGTIPLGIALPEEEVSPRTYACAVRALLQNWRQGTVGCKTRGDLAFSNKKPWKQKGTGRARVSSIRSPLWRKGGVIFGPQPRVRKLKVNRKQINLSLRNVLRSVIEKNAVYCVDFDMQNSKVPKTKEAFSVLKNINLHEKKGILFLSFQDSINYAAFRNIPNLGILFFDQPNVFDLSGTHHWIVLKKDFPLFKEMVAKWN